MLNLDWRVDVNTSLNIVTTGIDNDGGLVGGTLLHLVFHAKWRMYASVKQLLIDSDNSLPPVQSKIRQKQCWIIWIWPLGRRNLS